MTYTLDATDTDLVHGFRRVAADQLDAGIASLGGAGDIGIHEAVHDARKRCKKLRGMLRLFRGSFPDYKVENAALRDAARLLSDLRDSTAVIETYDRLMERYGALLERSAFAPLRASFTRDRTASGEAGDLSDRMAAMCEALEAIRGRVETWTLEKGGFKAIEDGLVRSYDRARAAMDVANDSRDPADMHEWRKRVKYHWYHMRLLSDARSDVLLAREATADRLSDVLGDHHDLEAFLPRLETSPLADDAVRLLRGLVSEEQGRLELEAFTLGQALLSPKPKRLANEVRQAVRTWYAAA
ncbi:CHAD domain-containing protein [Roseivivax marinus]|uniref:CHAD domain-containing protein n=1 Tax=Roseivivax marinus TaxID=1379903 RepID=UPI00273EBB3B|nr:CHAD domain-containing protein [Roseivivax marinus]